MCIVYDVLCRVSLTRSPEKGIGEKRRGQLLALTGMSEMDSLV